MNLMPNMQPLKNKTFVALLALCLAGPALASGEPHDTAPDRATTAAPAGDASLEAAITSVETFYAKIKTFKGDFTQVVKRAHLPRPLKKSGKVYFKMPGKMRWDYLQPDRVYYVSNGEVLWTYEKATKQALKMRVVDSELYDSLKFLFGKGDLRNSFNIELGKGYDDLTALIMTPKKGQQNYKRLTLFAKANGQIVRTELVDPLDNVSTITFSELTFDAELKDAAFDFKPPKGASVQDLMGMKPAPTPDAPKKAPETDSK